MRPLPAAAFQEHRAKLLLPYVKRTDPQITWRQSRLERMQDVVDLDEVLLGCLADVGRRELDLFESVHIPAVEIGVAAPVDQQLARGACNTGQG
jgi:hypothetical protein